MNKTLFFWLIHKFDHYQGFLSFLLSLDFCIQRLHLFYMPFFHQSQEDKRERERERERERMSKQCQKLRSKVKKSFVKLLNIYIYTLYHVAFGHFILSTVLFSFKISKYYWFANAWRYVLCLIFLIQHILTIFFLSEFSFESFAILFVAVFIYRPTDTFHS